ncbi:hypothetical protein [Burkholderia sp. Bp8963]|uniref:hypothetical protein n=1 Tax=Burkholderia sp. Bp8963 TaxID=2184547 RepID=UPI000F5A6127|nr:hypothetical protein [Burkholderia sp. Bp8963]
MDWTKVAALIKDDAPLLSGLLGGSVGLAVTTAAKLISHALSVPGDPDSVLTALGQVGGMQKVKDTESSHGPMLEQLTLSAAQSQMQQELELAGIAAADREAARQAQIGLKDWVPKALAVGVSLAFFLTIAALLIPGISNGSKDNQMLNVVVGALGTAWITIIGFYFGTSAGSARKTELLASSAQIQRDRGVAARGETKQTSEGQNASLLTTGSAESSTDNITHSLSSVAPGGQGQIYDGAS